MIFDALFSDCHFPLILFYFDEGGCLLSFPHVTIGTWCCYSGVTQVRQYLFLVVRQHFFFFFFQTKKHFRGGWKFVIIIILK